MINNTFALQSYKFFNAVGDGCYATAVNAFATSHEDRKLTSPLLAIGTMSKLISMIPFYAELEVSRNQPHPISGTSYPGLTGLISANIAALAGNTPISKAVSKVVSLVGTASLDYLNKTIVYETPSTLLCSNAWCNSALKGDPCLSQDWRSEKNIEVIYQHYILGCPFDMCYEKSSYKNFTDIKTYSKFIYYTIIFLVTTVSAVVIQELYQNPLQTQIQKTPGILKPLKNRLSLVAFNLISLVPSFVHLLAIQSSLSYRTLFVGFFTSTLANIPYLTAISIVGYSPSLAYLGVLVILMTCNMTLSAMCYVYRRSHLI